ncbi:MAG: ATP-dependent helicase RhlE [Pseudomonadota bacterium]|jgi:superfamily II DNA/RNA helicase
MTDPATSAAPAPAPAADAPPQRFDTLPLDPKLLRAVADSGYTSMTPIQAKAIPVVLAGHDVMGAAQTGTGKTAAFSIPLLQRMMKHENVSMSPARHPVRALVLAPTRELADQVANNVKAYAKHTGLRAAVVFGGVDMKPQTAELKKGVEILIATPGRLLDHIEAKNCVLNQVEYVVLDEADRMLDIGFLPDLQRILSYLPKGRPAGPRQTLLFSATFSPEIKKLASSYLNEPVLVEVARPNATASTVEQRFFRVGEDDKRRVVRQILRERSISQAIVFVNSKLGCARLARSFERDGLRTQALHGDKSQDERLKALAAFKAGEVDLLVATDVAARGLDIADLPAVFNFDVPFNAEDYVHRIGRTGRAGASGLAVTLVDGDDARDARLVAEIEKLIKKTIEPEAYALEDSRPRRGSWRDGERTERADRPDDRPPVATPRPEGVAAEASDDERPMRREERARWRGDDEDRRPRRAAVDEGPRRAPAVSSDPFFSQPYEPVASPDARAAWEQKMPAAPVPRPGASPNIRSKRKVASLLGGGPKG